MIYSFVRAVLRLFFGFFYRLETHGLENIPADGPVVLCSNHISVMDPPVVGIPLDRKVHYMAKEELFRVPGFGWLIKQLGAFPVKRGGVSKESIRNAIGLLKNNHVLGIFPEGTRKNPGGMGKKGASMLALKSNATVIPVAVVGDYKVFRKVRVYYGKPIDMTPFQEGGSDLMEAATDAIMQTIREMIAAHKNQ